MKYPNLQDIIDATILTLEKYDYSPCENAISSIIDKWFESKAHLFALLSKHPNWNPETMSINFDTDLEFKSENPLRTMARFLHYNSHIENANILLASLPPSHLVDRYVSEELEAYMTEQEIASHEKYITLRKGSKFLTWLNKMLKRLELEQLEGCAVAYNTVASSLAPSIVKRHTVLSLHPVDFLTMSTNSNYRSCHAISTNYGSACHRSGTISLMLDNTTMVFYTADPTETGLTYEMCKDTRQLFAYAEGNLLQQRLYTTRNEDKTVTSNQYRAIVQEVIATCEDQMNLWTHFYDVSVDCSGTFYPDYSTYNQYALNGSEKVTLFLGTDPMCIETGEEHQTKKSLTVNGYACYGCGYECDEDDLRHANGYEYCTDCVTYCERCDNYTTGEAMLVNMEASYGNTQVYWCEDCADEYAVETVEDELWRKSDTYQCDECNDHARETFIVNTSDGSENWCDNCLKDEALYCAKSHENYSSHDFYRCFECDEIVQDDCDCQEELEEVA